MLADVKHLSLQALIAGSSQPICPTEAAMDMQRLLIGLGLFLVVVGITWPLLTRIGFGRLPGDILFHRSGTTFYFPLATCIIISIALSTLLWLVNR
jgi:predicted membrane channel-forming protein YqfA (hemolysin III family)